MSRPGVVMSRLTDTYSHQRVLTVSLVVAVGVFTGMLVMSAGSAFSGSSDLESAALWSLVMRRVLEPETAVVALLIAGLAALYMNVSARSSTIRFNPYVVASGFLFVAASSLLLPFVPVRPMVLLAVCSAMLYRPRHTERWSFFILLLGVSLAFIVAAPFLVPLTGDQVRSYIPAGSQWLGFIPYLMAFGAVFCIKRLRWGLRQFESFYMVIVVGTSFLALEALLTFYMGLSLTVPGLEPSLLTYGMFQSALVQDQHMVSRLGLTATFVSLYFFVGRSQTRYLFSALAGFMVVLATMNRTAVMATAVGIAVYFVVGRSGGRRKTALPRRLASVVMAAVLLGGGFRIVQGMAETRSVNILSTAFEARLAHWARVADVLEYSPILGTGPGVDSYYLGSGSIPPKNLFAAAEWLGVTDRWVLNRVARNQLYSYQEDRGFSAHNAWLGLMMHWGLALGGFGVLYLVYQAFRAARTLALVHPSLDTRQAWLALALSVGLAVSVLTTSKFNAYWFFAITFYFTALNLKQIQENVPILEVRGKTDARRARPLVPG